MKNCSTRSLIVRLLLVMALVLMNDVGESESARQAAPAPAVDCSSLSLTMADCLSFVTSGSTVSKPEGSCCSGLKMVLKTDAECLCEGFKNSAQLGITLNVTKALTLPAACHVTAPSVSDCGLNIDTDGSPAVSPTGPSSPSAPAAAPPGSGSESAEVVTPTSAPGTSASSSVAASLGLIALALLSAAFVSLF